MWLAQRGAAQVLLRDLRGGMLVAWRGPRHHSSAQLQRWQTQVDREAAGFQVSRLDPPTMDPDCTRGDRKSQAVTTP
jgi:hypothetical protein